MIFISKNEHGELAWELVMDETKTVTRRAKPVEVGKVRAVCPGRGKFAVGYVKIIDCIPHKDWMAEVGGTGIFAFDNLEIEAKAEGFQTWKGLKDWMNAHKIDINETYRIEFELVKEE